MNKTAIKLLSAFNTARIILLSAVIGALGVLIFDETRVEYVDVPVPYEVTLEREVLIPVEKHWQKVALFGITASGQIVEDPEGEDGYLYLLTIRYNGQNSLMDASVWLHFGDDRYAGVTISFWADEYTVETKLVGEFQPEPADEDDF